MTLSQSLLSNTAHLVFDKKKKHSMAKHKLCILKRQNINTTIFRYGNMVKIIILSFREIEMTIIIILRVLAEK
jgi:hypothetical protein